MRRCKQRRQADLRVKIQSSVELVGLHDKKRLAIGGVGVISIP